MTATRKYPKPSDKNIQFLTASQRNLLVRTALHVITEKIPPLDMRFYALSRTSRSLDVYETLHGVNECGASCCLMGLAAFLEAKDNGIQNPSESWYKFGMRALGVTNDEYANGSFMFHGYWRSDREQAAARVLLWLRGQDVPISELKTHYRPIDEKDESDHPAMGEVYLETYLTSYSTAKLVRELKKFLVEE